MGWPKLVRITKDGTTKAMVKTEFQTWYSKIYLRSAHWYSTRQKILELVGYKCIFNCRICREGIELHHNKDGYENLWNESLIPGVHLIPLCRNHHEQHHFELSPWELEEAIKSHKSTVRYGYANTAK